MDLFTSRTLQVSDRGFGPTKNLRGVCHCAFLHFHTVRNVEIFKSSKRARCALFFVTSGIAHNQSGTRVRFDRNARRFQSCRWTRKRGFGPRNNGELSRCVERGAWARSTFGSDRSDVIGIAREKRSIEIHMRRYGEYFRAPQWNYMVSTCPLVSL